MSNIKIWRREWIISQYRFISTIQYQGDIAKMVRFIYQILSIHLPFFSFRQKYRRPLQDMDYMPRQGLTRMFSSPPERLGHVSLSMAKFNGFFNFLKCLCLKQNVSFSQFIIALWTYFKFCFMYLNSVPRAT